MGARYLDSARARLDRAETHFIAIKDAAKEFIASDPYEMWRTDDMDANECIFHVQIRRLPPEELTAILADCLHNYRSALDHIAWAICSRYGTTTNSRAFPIYLKRAKFREQLPRQLGDTGHCGAKAIIESFQPYKRHHRGDHNPLWFLHELDRFAKHRALSAAATVVPLYKIGASGPPDLPDVVMDHRVDWLGHLYGDALTLRVHILSHVLDEVNVEFDPMLAIGITNPYLEHEGPIPLAGALTRIRREVMEVFVALQPICERAER